MNILHMKYAVEVARAGSLNRAAENLYVPMELLDFKFRLMKWKGYKLIEPPITSRSNFLKDMPIPAEYSY